MKHIRLDKNEISYGIIIVRMGDYRLLETLWGLKITFGFN